MLYATCDLGHVDRRRRHLRPEAVGHDATCTLYGHVSVGMQGRWYATPHATGRSSRKHNPMRRCSVARPTRPVARIVTGVVVFQVPVPLQPLVANMFSLVEAVALSYIHDHGFAGLFGGEASPVPVPMWQGVQSRRILRQGRARCRCGCGRGEPSPGIFRCRCGRGEPSPGADVGG